MKLLVYSKSMFFMQVMLILLCFLVIMIFEVLVFVLLIKGILIYNILVFFFVCVIYVFLNKELLKFVDKLGDLILLIVLGVLCLFIFLSMYDFYIL